MDNVFIVLLFSFLSFLLGIVIGAGAMIVDDTEHKNQGDN